MKAISNRWAKLLGGEFLFICAVILGALLRLHDISEQIIADDEWHALHAALTMGYGEIASHFGIADYCIPLTLFYRMLLDTIGWSELLIRTPMLLCGIGSLILLPLLIRLWLDKTTSTIFAWLLAISPLHIYFSRYARPYNISLFFACVGLLAAFKWWTGGRRRWALLYWVCAVLGPYFHLTTLPFSIAPLLFFGTESLLFGKKIAVPRLRAVALLGCAVVLGLAMLLGPPLAMDYQALSKKAVANPPIGVETLMRSFQYFGGTVNLGLLLIMGFAGLAGAVQLAHRQRHLLVYLFVLLCVQGIALLIIKPALMHQPHILARYGIVFLPVFLLLVSNGLGVLDRLIRRKIPMLPPGMLGPLSIAGLLYYSPLVDPYMSPNNWTNHAYYQCRYHPRDRHDYAYSILTKERIPEFYLKLGELEPGRFRLLEAPWYHQWGNIPFVVYQRFHHQWMTIGFVGSRDVRQRHEELPLSDSRYRFQNFVHVGDFESIDRLGVDIVVFHLDLKGELPQITKIPHVNVMDWIEKYRLKYGEPVFEDQDIVVFDIRR